MIQMQSMLNVADNSGATKVMCIKVLGGSHCMFAHIASRIKVSVKAALPHAKVKKGDVCDAIIVRVKNRTRRKDGSTIKFDDNAVVLVDKNGNPIGTRVSGVVAMEVRHAGHSKIISSAQEVV